MKLLVCIALNVLLGNGDAAVGLRDFIRQLSDLRRSLESPSMTSRGDSEGLDVARLARALGWIGVIDNGTWVSFNWRDAEKIAAAYADDRQGHEFEPSGDAGDDECFECLGPFSAHQRSPD